MLNIGDFVTIRNWKTFFKHVKPLVMQAGCAPDSYHTNIYWRRCFSHRLESNFTDDLILMEIEKVGPLKWHVVSVCTEEASYNLSDDKIFLNAQNFDISALAKAKPTKWYNELLGEQTELRVKAEQNAE